MPYFRTFISPLSLAILLVPLIFWSLTTDYFFPPKLFILLLLLFSLLTSWVMRTVLSQKLAHPRLTLLFPLLGLVITIVANLYFLPEGRPEALAGTGTLFILLPLIALFLASLDLTQFVKATSLALIVAAFTLGLFTLLQFTLLPHLSFIPSFITSPSFSPTGSLFASLTLIVIGSALTLTHLIRRATTLIGFTLIVQIISLVTLVALLLPGSPITTTLLPLRASLQVAGSALSSSTSSFLLGVGLANYSSFFTTVKPLYLNATPLWNIVPAHAHNAMLTILTTTGILGFGCFVSLLIVGIYQFLRRPTPLAIAWFISALALMVTPPSLVLYFLFFVLLPFVVTLEAKNTSLSRPVSWILGLLPPLLLSALLPLVLLPHLADYHLRRAQLAAASYDSQATYSSQLRAIKLAPTLTLPHLSYAETNLRIASALSQKPNLTPDEQQTLATLLQQAIRESKTAIALRPHDSLPYLSLAQIYQQLIPVSSDAARFASDYYVQAISLDRGNPSLHVAFGQLLLQLGNPDRAKSEFQTALQLKADYAPAQIELAKLSSDVVK